MVGDSSNRDPVELLGEEFMERRRSGQPASVEEYATANPQWSTEIRRLFPAMLALEQFCCCNLEPPDGQVQLHLEELHQLGDYRIIREIGRGGMGVVFEAEQESLGRRVAVKVFPRQMLLQPRRLERFHREAQTAASLHHTNIVPVFGVGQQDGVHYFVMQRIDGIGLDHVLGEASQPQAQGSGDTAADTRPESTSDMTEIISDTVLAREHAVASDDRPQHARGMIPQGVAEWSWVAEVGIQVAHALHYAHSKGVLHRDIKPGNLLLDSRGSVWVTDFGLAKILHDETRRASEIVGTLRFMAPEQLAGQQDARSDVYSLGLTLYELLTRTPAFDHSDRAVLMDQIVQGSVAPPRAIRPEIPSDLEAIVLKAISPDPNSRYQDAQSLAVDLRLFMEDRPVGAQPIGPPGRLRRWCRRNPAVATLSVTLLLLGFISVGVISLKWRDAVAANRRAENNLSLALDSLDRVLGRFTTGWMAHPVTLDHSDGSSEMNVGLQIAVSNHGAAVLQDAVKFYDQFAIQNIGNPRIRRETANVHQRVGQIYERLGQYTLAEQAYTRCLDALEPDWVEQDVNLAIDMAITRNRLGRVLYATSRFIEAESEYQAAQRILSAEPLAGSPRAAAELARVHINLGQLFESLRRHRGAELHHRQALELLEQLVDEHAGEADYRLDLARAYRICLPSFGFSGSDEEHTRIHQAGVEILEQLVRDFPEVPDYQCELSEMLAAGARPRGAKQIKARKEQLQRAVDLARELSGKYPSIPRYRIVLARALQTQGQLQIRLQNPKAEPTLSEAVDIYRTLATASPDVPVYDLFMALAMRDHAECLRRLNRLDEARDSGEGGIAAQRAYLKRQPRNPFGRRILSALYDELALTLSELQLTDEAKQARGRAERLRPQAQRQ